MDEKIYYTPGDVVELKQDIPNKPVMIVGSIDKTVLRTGDSTSRPGLFGITCFWFTTEGTIQERRFSTKDLIHYEV